MSQSAVEIRNRTVRGAVLVAVRGVASRAIGLVGTVVVARLLSPHDFGLFAFGSTMMTSVTALTQTGIGAGLVRARDEPTRAQLGAVVTVNCCLTSALTGAMALVAIGLGANANVIVLMAAVLVLTSFRAPAVILLERRLSYGPVARVEVFETLLFYSLSVAGVLALGVWGIAVAAGARCLLGTVLMLRAARAPWLPQVRIEAIRELFGFGVRMQAISVTNFLRDQTMIVSISAIGGVAALGVFTVAYRLLQLPLLMFESLFRVSFPAMARLLETGADPRSLIERGMRMTAVGAALTTVPVVVAAPGLIPLLFGDDYSDAALVLIPAAAGLMIFGAVSVACAGYLFAVGDASTVLRAAILHTLAWCAITLPLLPAVGVVAAGFGMLASGATEVAVIGRRTAQVVGVRWWAQVRRTCLTGLGVLALTLPPAVLTDDSWPAMAGLVMLAQGTLVLAIRRFDPVGYRLMLDTGKRFLSPVGAQGSPA